MLQISIDKKIKDKIPELRLGVLIFDVEVTNSNEQLIETMDITFGTLKSELTTADISKLINIQKSRLGYRALGKDPTKYRISSEKLLRRVIKGEGVDNINNIVDLSNLVSVISHNSIGTYDLDQIKGDVFFTYGVASETYLNIGNQEMNLENLPIFKDEEKAFGSTTADSRQTAVTETTKRILMNIISFNKEDNLQSHMELAEGLLIQYGSGQLIDKKIIY